MSSCQANHCSQVSAMLTMRKAATTSAGRRCSPTCTLPSGSMRPASTWRTNCAREAVQNRYTSCSARSPTASRRRARSRAGSNLTRSTKALPYTLCNRPSRRTSRGWRHSASERATPTRWWRKVPALCQSCPTPRASTMGSTGARSASCASHSSSSSARARSCRSGSSGANWVVEVMSAGGVTGLRAVSAKTGRHLPSAPAARADRR